MIVKDIPFNNQDWEPVSIASFNFKDSKPPWYGDIIVEGWPGNFGLDRDNVPEFFQIDANGRVSNQESLNAVLTGIAENRPDQTSSVAFKMKFPVDGEFAIYVTEIRDTEPAPKLTVVLDDKKVLVDDLIPIDRENYHPVMHNQYFTVKIPKGSHTISIANSGGGRIVTSFELKKFILRNGPDLDVRGLQSEDYILLWLKNQKYTVLHELVDIGIETQPGGVLEVNNVPNGTWIAEWVNTISATRIKTELVKSVNHKLILNTPSVEKSMAIRLQRF